MGLCLGRAERGGSDLGPDRGTGFGSTGQGTGVAGGVSALAPGARVSCNSLITSFSFSFPLLFPALPVPTPDSTSSWAKLSMLSRILISRAPSSSSPGPASVHPPWGATGATARGLEDWPLAARCLTGSEGWVGGGEEGWLGGGGEGWVGVGRAGREKGGRREGVGGGE